jgi:putative nucleotidyltransferase with HDIG domain
LEQVTVELSDRPVPVASLRLVMYAAALVTAAGGLISVLVVADYSFGPLPAVLALGLLAFLAERQSVRLSSAIEISVAFLPFVFAAVVFGPLAAATVGAIGLLSDLRRPYVRWCIWTASRVIVAATCGVAAVMVGAQGADRFGALLVAVGAATVTEVVLDGFLTGLTLKVRGTGSLRTVGRDILPILAAAVPLYTPVIAALAFAYREVSPWSVVLFLIPAFAAQRLFVLYRQQRETADHLSEANDRLARANLSFASALVATLDARDQYTAGHSAAVAVYARDIANRMGLSDADQQLAHLCGLVHDIGKIGLAASLLEKSGPLTLDERRQMEQHTVIGERILANVEDYSAIARIVRHHHERVDGNGYPDRLEGNAIPLLSRILAVADSYDAMTSDRPYRGAMPSRVARLRLAQAVESQFDTSVVAAFEAILASSTEAYRSGAGVRVPIRDQEPPSLELIARAG